jgi:hypothetical protein
MSNQIRLRNAVRALALPPASPAPTIFGRQSSADNLRTFVYVSRCEGRLRSYALRRQSLRPTHTRDELNCSTSTESGRVPAPHHPDRRGCRCCGRRAELFGSHRWRDSRHQSMRPVRE